MTTTTKLEWRQSYFTGQTTYCADPDGYVLRVCSTTFGAHWNVIDLATGKQMSGETPLPDAIDSAKVAAEAAWSAMVTA